VGRVPAAGTRPTSDRVREALFSLLDARLDWPGMRVLDLYAGSGALGLEALSRGAAHALLVESDRRAADIAGANSAALGLSGAVVRVAAVSALLATGAEQPYDVVFADPPYALPDADVAADLRALGARGWVGPGSFVIVERSSRSGHTAWPAGFVGQKARRYGETRIDLAVVETVASADTF
jgi:16S rRNA (guanine966-N2)-methyltransferase